MPHFLDKISSEHIQIALVVRIHVILIQEKPVFNALFGLIMVQDEKTVCFRIGLVEIFDMLSRAPWRIP